MEKYEGLHFYINVPNFYKVMLAEEASTQKITHSIHALDVLFSSVELFGKKYYPKTFVVEKITGSRLHLYVKDEIAKAYGAAISIIHYASCLAKKLIEIERYSKLIPFILQVGASYGGFYEFEFQRKDADELTTIGYAANYAAKLQAISNEGYLSISEDIWTILSKEERQQYTKKSDNRISKYGQDCYYTTGISMIKTSMVFDEDFKRSYSVADAVNRNEVRFTTAKGKIDFRTLTVLDGKKVNGIPMYADIRGFTQQFDSDDANLEEMAEKTQDILTTMYELVEQNHGLHVQFQGDREFALFHDYENYNCCLDAVTAGMRVIDAVKQYSVSVGVGESMGSLFAVRLGARGEKDNLLFGETVLEADRYEDEKAQENQLVISTNIYNTIKKINPLLAEQFSPCAGMCYVTTCGYRTYMDKVQQRRLQRNNQHSNYNGAWGK